MKKKIWALMLTAAALSLGLVACGDKKEKSSTDETCRHVWDEGRVTVEPTCVTDGEKTYVCTECGENKKEDILAQGHTWTDGTLDGIYLVYDCADCDNTKRIGLHVVDQTATTLTFNKRAAESVESIVAHLGIEGKISGLFIDSRAISLREDMSLDVSQLSEGKQNWSIFINDNTVYNVTVEVVDEPVVRLEVRYQQSGEVFGWDSLDSLKKDIEVEAFVDGVSQGLITEYTLRGELTAGECEITLTYLTGSATISVVVTPIVITSTQVDILSAEIREYLTASFADSYDLAKSNTNVNADEQRSIFTFKAAYADSYTVRFSTEESFEEYTDRIYQPLAAAEEYSVNLRTLLPDTTYYVKVFVTDNEEICSPVQEIRTENCVVRTISAKDEQGNGPANVRDMGGYQTADGKTVAYGLVYRGGTVNQIKKDLPDPMNEYSRAIFKELGIYTEIDLRTENVDDGYKDGNGVYHPQTLNAIDSSYPYYKNMINPYDRIFDTSSHLFATAEFSIRKTFATFANADSYPVYFHCNAGADRTGTVAFLLLGMLGVSYEDITRDFELTSFSVNGKRLRDECQSASEGNYIAYGRMYNTLMQKYDVEKTGNLQTAVINYLLSIGITETQIHQISSIMLGEPCLALSKIRDIGVDEKSSVAAKIYDKNLVKEVAVRYESSDSSIVTVDEEGAIKGLKAGSATITATATYKGKSYADEITVWVKDSYIRVNDATIMLPTDRRANMSYRYVREGQVCNETITWTSSNDKIATVDDAGVVTAHGVGKVIVTAKSADGVTGSATVDIVYDGAALEMDFSAAYYRIPVLVTDTSEDLGVVDGVYTFRQTVTSSIGGGTIVFDFGKKIKVGDVISFRLKVDSSNEASSTWLPLSFNNIYVGSDGQLVSSGDRWTAAKNAGFYYDAKKEWGTWQTITWEIKDEKTIHANKDVFTLVIGFRNEGGTLVNGDVLTYYVDDLKLQSK